MISSSAAQKLSRKHWHLTGSTLSMAASVSNIYWIRKTVDCKISMINWRGGLKFHYWCRWKIVVGDVTMVALVESLESYRVRMWGGAHSWAFYVATTGLLYYPRERRLCALGLQNSFPLSPVVVGWPPDTGRSWWYFFEFFPRRQYPSQHPGEMLSTNDDMHRSRVLWGQRRYGMPMEDLGHRSCTQEENTPINVAWASW